VVPAAVPSSTTGMTAPTQPTDMRTRSALEGNDLGCGNQSDAVSKMRSPKPHRASGSFGGRGSTYARPCQLLSFILSPAARDTHSPHVPDGTNGNPNLSQVLPDRLDPDASLDSYFSPLLRTIQGYNSRHS